MPLKFIDEIDCQGKKILCRFDFNVPFEKEGEASEGKVISDPTRIDATLETIKYLLEQGAKQLILMSHLGRPKGSFKKEFSLEPVGKYLAEALKTDVILTESCLDLNIKPLLDLNSTKIILLENLRFHAEEEKNDFEFAKKLASYADIYLNDAFGAAHREHASTHAINYYFKESAVGGFLLKQEIQALEKVTEKPKNPFVAVLGGAKVSDKIQIIQKLLPMVDKLLIGGAMAYPFLQAKGFSVGKSLCSEEDKKLADMILASQQKSKIVLPLDHVVSDNPNGEPMPTSSVEIDDDKMGLDIGEGTISLFKNELKNAKTIFWNGPMGLFENDDFSKGTFEVALALSSNHGFTMVGGGDSVAAVKKAQLESDISHISTGGGASLEFIEKGHLPGIQALKFGVSPK
ncbi:MAG: phosphoglycerate kinase [Halobacteriovoraceae bacterium]|nr:phosphoglycerate kinase [Halobacteriovoraceae bacterium]